jgi:SUN domain-containing protein 1/2
VRPGECWPFKGANGFLVIQLSTPVGPSMFSLEHIPRTMSPAGDISSAPKNFRVLGLMFEKDPEPFLFGEYEYRSEDDPLQYFPVMNSSPTKYPIIELQILSNHGNVHYTCLYRFRVHGKPA